jgi:hypothetical protein
MRTIFRTRAAFLFPTGWRWVAWNHPEPSHQKAIIDKGYQLGATGWDFGNADHGMADRWNHATRG